MTREQIDFVREKSRHDIAAGLRPDLEPEEVNDLLAAAERALLLEDVLAAAKAFNNGRMCAHGLMQPCVVCDLRAAIDRAEKP